MRHIYKIVVAHLCRILKICLKIWNVIFTTVPSNPHCEYFTLFNVSLEKLS